MTRPQFQPEQAKAIARAFEAAGVDYLFIGLGGAILLGFPAVTQDVHIFPARDPENGRRIATSLRNLGFDISEDLEQAIVRGEDFVQIKTGPFDVDLVFAVRRIGSTWSGVRSLLKTSTCSTSVPSDGRFAPCGGRFRWDGGVDAGIA